MNRGSHPLRARSPRALHRPATRPLRWHLVGVMIACLGLAAVPCFGETVVARYRTHYVLGLDSATGNMKWDFRRPKINFAELVPEGVLVGSDDGALVMLDRETGHMKWQALFGQLPINGFQGSFESGYLVSSDPTRSNSRTGVDHHVWLVSRDGKVVWHFSGEIGPLAKQPAK